MSVEIWDDLLTVGMSLMDTCWKAAKGPGRPCSGVTSRCWGRLSRLGWRLEIERPYGTNSRGSLAAIMTCRMDHKKNDNASDHRKFITQLTSSSKPIKISSNALNYLIFPQDKSNPPQKKKKKIMNYSYIISSRTVFSQKLNHVEYLCVWQY